MDVVFLSAVRDKSDAGDTVEGLKTTFDDGQLSRSWKCKKQVLYTHNDIIPIYSDFADWLFISGCLFVCSSFAFLYNVKVFLYYFILLHCTLYCATVISGTVIFKLQDFTYKT